MLSRPSNKLLPRQSGVSNPSVTGSTATPTNSPQSSDTISSQNADPSTPISLAVPSTDVQSQPLSSSSLSSASSTASPDLTTTTPSTTTSVSQPQSTTQQPTSTTPTSSSESPTSSHLSSSAPGMTSSNTPSTTSPPQTTSHPPGSTSPPGTPTTITSSYVTYINGSQVATQTIIPTTIPSPQNTSSNRTLTIAGSAAGAAALLIAILSIAFCARRKHFKRLKFLDAITSRRKQAHSRATLLAGEDLDDVGLAQRPPGRYSDYETPWDGSQRSLVGRGNVSRGSETGSVFREDVWPPPSESSRLMDPLAQSMSIDLRRIVDDVMGPSTEVVHFSQHSISSSHRGSVDESDGGRGEHSRNWSNGSQVALLEAAGLGSPAGALSTVPVRSSPLAQAESKPGSEAHKGGGAP